MEVDHICIGSDGKCVARRVVPRVHSGGNTTNWAFENGLPQFIIAWTDG